MSEVVYVVRSSPGGSIQGVYADQEEAENAADSLPDYHGAPVVSAFDVR